MTIIGAVSLEFELRIGDCEESGSTLEFDSGPISFSFDAAVFVTEN